VQAWLISHHRECVLWGCEGEGKRNAGLFVTLCAGMPWLLTVIEHCRLPGCCLGCCPASQTDLPYSKAILQVLTNTPMSVFAS